MPKKIITVVGITILFLGILVSPMTLGYDFVSDRLEVKEVQSSIDDGGLMDSAWPKKSHDNKNTGLSQYSTENNPGLEKWRTECGWVKDSPAIASDGTIYLGGVYESFPWYLIALYPNGSVKWKCYLGDQCLIWGSSPAIAEDGTIYVGDWRSLNAINPNGTLKWKFYLDFEKIYSSPAIDDDGVIYFGTLLALGYGGKIYAVNADGSYKWHYQTRGSVESSPAIDKNGIIYIGSWDSYLYAMYPDGTLFWRFKTSYDIRGTPSIGEDGTIYIGSCDDYLYAINPNGTMKWKINIGYGTCNSQAIGIDGTIYVGTDKVYAINPDGTYKWIFDIGDDRSVGFSSPAISMDGTIYVGVEIRDSGGGEIIAINSDGTEKWRKKISNKYQRSSPVIGEDGTVYIGSISSKGADSYGYLHAFGTVENNEPPSTPIINGPINGKIWNEYTYSIVSNDPENYPIRYYVNWGDSTNTGWTWEYDSNEIVNLSHKWYIKSNYTIKVKAMDIYNDESDWGELTVTIPRDKTTSISSLLRFLERFPLLKRLLNLLR